MTEPTTRHDEARQVELIDITVPIRPGMFVYPGDPEVHLERDLVDRRQTELRPVPC